MICDFVCLILNFGDGIWFFFKYNVILNCDWCMEWIICILNLINVLNKGFGIRNCIYGILCCVYIIIIYVYWFFLLDECVLNVFSLLVFVFY